MESLFEFSPLVVAVVPLVVGIVQVVKGVGLDSKYAPIASVVAGVGLIALTGVTWQATIVQGLIAGLAASGLWSGTKSVVSS